MTKAVSADASSATNPLFNERPLKLGSFSTNLSGGGTISKMDGLLKAELAGVRAVRPGAIETSDQEKFVLDIGKAPNNRQG